MKYRLFVILCALYIFPAHSLENTQVAIITQVAMDVEQDASTIPGALTAVANDSEVIWQGTSNCNDLYETSGMKCPGTTVHLTDQVRIGSETKTYTGTVILKMIDEGYLKLTDTLSAYLPDLNIPNADTITIKNLLQMTSTIPDYLNAPALAAFGGTGTINDQYVRAYGKLNITPPEIYIEATNSMDRTSGMSYSNTNFAILALIAEKVSCGMPSGCQTLETLLNQYVLNPLSMNATALPTDDQFTQPYNTGYVMIVAGQPITGTESLNSDQADQYLDDFTFLSPSLPWAAGAMIATMDDQVIWGRQLVKNNQNLLTNAMQQQRLNDTVAGNVAGVPAEYGLAIYHMKSSYNNSEFTGHSGSIYGFTASLFYDANTQLYYSVYVNQAPAVETSRDFLWQVEKGIQFLQDQNGNCQGEPQPLPSTCSGLNTRTSSLTVPTGNALILDPSQLIYTGYNTGDCTTDSVGKMTCSVVENMAPTVVFYGHDLEGIQMDSGSLTLKSKAILQCSGRNCSAIATTGSPVLNIYGTIITEGTGSQAIKGGSGNDTVRMYAGASISGNIDLGSGDNDLNLAQNASFTGNVLLSTPEIKLSNGDQFFRVKLDNNQVYITDAQGLSRTYAQETSTTSVTFDDQTITSDSLLIPIDIDNNGQYDLVVYHHAMLNANALKVSSFLFQTGFRFTFNSSSGAPGWLSLVALCLGWLCRYNIIHKK